MVDILGFILHLKVSTADVRDRSGTKLLLPARLIRDHRVRMDYSEALTYQAMIKRMLARIAQ